MWATDPNNDGNTDDRMDVINMSFGGTYNSWLLDAACLLAYYQDELILVAAAGNSGNPGGGGDNVGYPAAYDSVIAVAATNQNDERASWSSTGSEVELAAPGVSVTSTWLGGGYASKSGTSMACPHVAGTAALVWAINSGWSNEAVRTQLQDTADDLGAAGWDSKYGYGLIDADEAAGVSGGIPEPPSTGGTMHVDSIDFSAKKAGKNLFLYTTIKILLEDNTTAVNSATVSMTLTHGESLWNFTGDTGSDGTVKFTLLKAQAGNYTATVTEVSHPDYAWDGSETTGTCYLSEGGTVQ